MFASAPLVYQCKDGDVNFAAFAGPGMGESTAALSRWVESEGMASETLKNINWITFEWHTVSQEVLDEVGRDFSRFFMTRTKGELFDEAVKRGIMLYPGFTPRDMLEFRQLAARNYWVDIEHPELGTKITYTNPFINVEGATPPVQKRAPLVGEHNEEIYTGELGLSKQDLLTLKQINAI
jgi:crotonobetainyl-CoA:carnitine CoA-transferase CaiB-like acyl-CoA transferase